MSALAALVHPSLGADKNGMGGLMSRASAAISTLRNYRLLRAALRNPSSNPELFGRLDRIDRILDAMKPEHAQILKALYIQPHKERHRILEELAISESTFYRRKAAALRSFTTAVSGYF